MPPDGGGTAPQAALNLAFVARGEVQLATTINGDVPEIGLRKGVLDKVQKSDPVPKPK